MFNRALDFLLKKEGGYVNNPKDPGGETKYGISKRSYPSVDIKNLSLQQASDIYYKDYWLTSGANTIKNQRVATFIFVTGVNTGITFVKNMTKSILASKKSLSLNALDPEDVIQNMQLLTIKRYVSIVNGNPDSREFLLGWLNRVLDENFD